jgi:hypothetical protein
MDNNYQKTQIELLASIDQRLKKLNSSNGLHMDFLKGLIYGLGFIIGTTILFAVILFILRQFFTVPVIGEYVRQIVEFVQTK